MIGQRASHVAFNGFGGLFQTVAREASAAAAAAVAAGLVARAGGRPAERKTGSRLAPPAEVGRLERRER